ncbi:MAG: hypothetical protein AAGG56_16720 [Pseudomonadota bacterium]
MTRGAAAALVLVLAVSACADRGGLPPDAATSRAVTKQDAGAPPAQGEVGLTVQSFSTGGVELRGAVCEADSVYFSAQVTTPGRILMPYFGDASPEVTLTCRLAPLSGQQTVGIVQTSQRGGTTVFPSLGVGVSSNGGVGVGLGVGVSGTRSSRVGTEFGYPPARVTLQ